MKKFDLNIGDIVFVYKFTNESKRNEEPKPMKLTRHNLINHWKGNLVNQYIIVDSIKIEGLWSSFGNWGSPFSRLVRINYNDCIIVSDSLTQARARINMEYDRRKRLGGRRKV